MSRKVIWKVNLQHKDAQEVTFPAGAEIIHCHAQDRKVYLWFVCDPEEKEIVTRNILLIPTGLEHEIGNNRYLGTVHLANGLFVLHCFETLE